MSEQRPHPDIHVRPAQQYDGGCYACSSSVNVAVISTRKIETRFCGACLKEIMRQWGRLP